MTIAALRRLVDAIDQETAAPPAPPPYHAPTVRAWAAQTGVDCPALGPIPRLVAAAWHAAQQQTDGAAP
ncbi:hypothetical protein [Streptomyces sp. STCH 565 A]|uniref:hypothetical protein n=1 Tax=Streptomyces sp. STCH 565 A TaxID=2950532 RepID=UPI0020751C51|nr:hypothetical protein [Streptomyces sp. STCH 565 A]MCM8550041.1 hypothetical protein [Streptomyces sp. STCH 565 A]